MAVNIKLKRSAVPGNIPTTAQLELGEIALNTHDGKAFFKKDDGTQSVVELASYTSGSTVASASYATIAGTAYTASYVLNALSSSYALTASYVTLAQTASYVLNALSSSYALTSSYAYNTTNATSASYAQFANTASSADNFTVRGTLTAQTIIVQYITSSQELVTGSLTVNGPLNALGGVTGSLEGTASWASNAVSSSYAVNASTAASASYALNASNAVSASFATNASLAASASYALSSSYALNASNAASASFASNASTAASASFATNASTAASASYALSASYAFNASTATSASYANNSSTAASSSYANNASTAASASYALQASNAVSASFATQAINADFLNNTGSLSFVNTGSFNVYSGSVSTRISNLENFSSSYSTGSFTGSFNGTFSGSLNNLQGTPSHIPFFSSSQILANSAMLQVDDGSGVYSIAINENAVDTLNPEALFVSQTSTSSFNVITGKGNLNNYLQLNIKNTNQGTNASSDVVATANNGNEFANYINMGINSQNFSGFLGGPNDAYLFATGSEFHIGNITPNKHLGFFVGGGDVDTGNKFALYPTNQHQMTGSLDVSGSVKAFNFTGSLLGDVTGSLLGTASWANNATSASYALNASTATSASFATNASTAASASYALSSSYSYNTSNAASASYALNASTAASASFATNASTAASASFANNASTAASASYALSSSYAYNASTATSASYATQANTASSADNFNVRGTLTAQTLVVQTITSSVSYLTGSSRFGSDLSNTHTFTGSILVTGSITVADGVTNNLTASWANRAISSSFADNTSTAASASYALSSSYTYNASTAASASYALSSSYAYNASTATSASFATNASTAASASFATNASTAASASFATNASTAASASYALNASTAASASFATNAASAASASYALSSSYAVTASFANNSISSSFASQAANAASSSYALNASTATSASFATSAANATTASYATFAATATSASIAANAVTASYVLNAVSSSFASSGNGVFSGSFSGSFFGNGGGLTNIPASSVVGLNLSQIASGSVTASVDLNGFKVNSNATISGSTQITGSLGVTGSVSIAGTGTVLSANVDTIVFTGSFASSGSVTINGDITSTGTITAQTLNVQVITSSVSFITGSTKFGTIISNTHQFTGSVSVSGSLAVNGSNVILTNQTSSMSVATASYVLNAVSASFATSAATATTASYILNAASASYALNAGLLNGTSSAGFATTGSNTFRGNQTVTGSLFTSGSNTLIGSTTLTGSLLVSGSTTQIGNNTLIGNTILSGSLLVSGSQGLPTATIGFFGDVDVTGTIGLLPVSRSIDTTLSGSYIYVSGSTQDLYFSQNSKGYTNTTRLRWLEGNLYTGLLNGGLITAVTGSTTYQVSSGSGIIVNLNASLNDNPYPTIKYINWGNLSASIAPLTASYQQAFVSIDSTGNIYQQGTPYAAGQFDTEINIGVVLFQNGSTINGVKTQPTVAYGFEQQQNIFNRAFGPLKLSGYTLAPSGSSTRSLIVAGGTAYSPGSNYSIDPNNPSYTTDSGTNVSKIFRYRQSGSTWVYDTNAGAGYTTIDPTQYSDNGVLTAVPGTGINREFSIQRVFYFPNSVAKAIVVYYGNATYASLTEATSNIAFEPFVEAPNTAANAIYLGAIIVRNDADFTVTDSYAIQAGGLFRSVGGSGGGGSVITQTLSGLSDVSISGPTTGQALVYDTTAAKWRNLSFISASISGNAATATNATTASYVLNAISSSYAATASNAVSSSYALNSSTATSASFATNAATAVSSSYTAFAATASSADNFTVRGTLTAQTLIVQTITSSVELITGSLTVSGSLDAVSGVTGSLLGTASYAVSASYADNSVSSSVAISASYALSASYADNSTSSSVAISASFAATASELNPVTSLYVDEIYSKDGILTPTNRIFTKNNNPVWGGIGDIVLYGSADDIYLHTPGGNIRLNAGGGTNSVQITGSLEAPSITGSLAGTASYALTASYAVSASYADNATTASYALTASTVEGGTANYLPLWFSNTKLTSSIAYQNASGIGINDISPSHKLQVSGDVSISNSSNALNATKYSLIGGLNLTTTGTETNQYANVGAYGSLGFSATSSTFTPQDNSFVSAFLGQFSKSGGGNISGKVSSYAAGINLSGAGNVTTIAGFRAYAPLQSFALPSFTGTLTNYIGLLVDDITGTTDVGSRITNKWGIYQTGASDKNYFAGTTTFAGGLTGSLAGTASYALTASFALNGGGGGISAIYIADEGILQGTASYFDFTGAGVTTTVSAGTASISINGGGSGGFTQTFNQASPALSWSFTHNLGTYTPIVQVYDSTYKTIIPSTISGSSLNTTLITFAVPTSGYAVISTGGTVTITGSNAVLNQTVAATTWSFHHGLNETHPVFTVFDSNDDVIIPLRIHAENAQTASIYFSTPKTGTAVAANCGLSGSTFESASYALTSSFALGSGTAMSASYAATASYTFNAVSSSYALNASTATSASFATNASTATSSSFANNASTAASASYALNASTATSSSFATNASTATSSSFATQAANAVTASYILNAASASYALNASTAASASYALSSSYALNASTAASASYALNASTAASASYATFANTASSADNFNVRGTLTATTIVVQTITSSVNFVTGSTRFGSLLSNTHQFTGSVGITGSLSTSGPLNISGSSTITGSLIVAPNSSREFEVTSTGVNIGNIITDAHNVTGSLTISGSVLATNFTGSLFGTATTASYVLNAVSSSFATSAATATTASYILSAASASYAVTASFSRDFTVGSSLIIDRTLTDYASVAASSVGSNNLFTQATSSYTSAFFKYTVANGSNTRAGEVVAAWNGTSTQFYDNSTLDIGNTTPVTASVVIVSGQVQFNMQTNTSGWTIKSLATFM